MTIAVTPEQWYQDEFSLKRDEEIVEYSFDLWGLWDNA